MDVVVAKYCADEAIKLASEGHLETAIDKFSEAIACHPYDFRYFLNRSYCHFYLTHYEESLKDANQAIALCQVSNAKPMYRRALALLALGRLPEALEAFESVLRIDPTCPVSVEKRQEIRSSLLQAAGVAKKAADDMARGDESLSLLLRSLAIKLPDPQVLASPKPDDDDVPLNCGHHSSGSESLVPSSSSSSCMTAVKTPAEAVAASDAQDSGQESEPQGGASRQSLDPEEEVLLQVMNTIPALLDVTPATNPIGFHAISVGNVSRLMAKELATTLFSSFGRVEGVFRLKMPASEDAAQGNECTILVQFKDSEAPVQAVNYLRGKLFVESGFTANPLRPFTLRLTASQQQKPCKFLSIREAQEACLAAQECFAWRGPVGCLAEECDLRHTRANHRLDSHSYFFWLSSQ